VAARGKGVKDRAGYFHDIDNGNDWIVVKSHPDNEAIRIQVKASVRIDQMQTIDIEPDEAVRMSKVLANLANAQGERR
jgi:hypothetical protein